MAHNVTSKDIPLHGEKIEAKHISRPKFIALVIFVIGAIASALLFTNDTWGAGYAYSWVFAFMFFISLALGGAFWMTLHHVTNSGWGVSIRRLMENLGFVFPFFAIIVIPLLIPSVQNNLYEWMVEHREIMVADEANGGTQAASAYGNAYHALHIESAIAKEQGNEADHYAHLLYKARKVSTIVMPIFAVVATFIALDFMMALDYKWFSTMYGVYFFAGCALNSMAVLILTLTWLRSKGYLKVVTSKEHYHIMGKLMHAFVIFWAYVSFAQFMLIWYANITEETSYFLLLPHYSKKVIKIVVPICIYILVMHIVDLYIAVIPERGPSLTHGEDLFVSHNAFLGDIVAFITVGAFFVFVFLRNIGSANLYPNRDARLLESANLHN